MNGNNVNGNHWFNKTLSTKLLLTVTAATELGAGLALLCVPSSSAEFLAGAPLETPIALTLARVCGAGLLALCVASWLARNDVQSRAARGLVVAMSVYDSATVAILTYAGLGFELQGTALWPGVILHGMMTVWCVCSLCSNSKCSNSNCTPNHSTIGQ